VPARNRHADGLVPRRRDLRLLPLRTSERAHGLPWARPQRTLQRRQAAARKHYQERKRARSQAHGRGRVALSASAAPEPNNARPLEGPAGEDRRPRIQGPGALASTFLPSDFARQAFSSGRGRRRTGAVRLRLGHRQRMNERTVIELSRPPGKGQARHVGGILRKNCVVAGNRRPTMSERESLPTNHGHAAAQPTRES
jgi:hypothetical protein